MNLRILAAVEGQDDRAFLNAAFKHLQKQGILSDTELLIWSLGGKDRLKATQRSHEAKVKQEAKTFYEELRTLINDPQIELNALNSKSPAILSGAVSGITLKDVTHLLLVLDADEKPQDTAERLKANFTAIREQGVNLIVPEEPGVWQGCDAQNAEAEINLHAGFYLLPGKDKDGHLRKGSLESLLLETIGEAHAGCLTDFRACGGWNATQSSDKVSEDDVQKEKVIEKPVVQAFLAAKTGQKKDNKYCSLPVSFEQGLWPLDDATFTPLLTFLQQAASA